MEFHGTLLIPFQDFHNVQHFMYYISGYSHFDVFPSDNSGLQYVSSVLMQNHTLTTFNSSFNLGMTGVRVVLNLRRNFFPYCAIIKRCLR